MNRALRKEALIRACEYDRLQIRLACARADLEHASAQHSRSDSATSQIMAAAQTAFRVLPVGDLLRVGLRFFARR